MSSGLSSRARTCAGIEGTPDPHGEDDLAGGGAGLLAKSDAGAAGPVVPTPEVGLPAHHVGIAGVGVTDAMPEGDIPADARDAAANNEEPLTEEAVRDFSRIQFHLQL